MTARGLLLSALLVGVPVFATTITFGEAGLVAGYAELQAGVPKGTTLTDQLAGLGVMFSSSAVNNNVSDGSFVPSVPGDGNFLVVINQVLGGAAGHLRITFSGGATGISFNVYDTNVDPAARVTANAYDAMNALIGSIDLGNNPSALISFQSAAYIDVLDIGGDGYGLDNLAFTNVPEPATYALIGLGLAALGMIRSRRRR